MANNNTTVTIEQELQNYGENLKDITFTLHTSLNIVLGSIITIFGLIGNALSFAVYSRDKQSLVASLLFKSISLVDSIVLISNTLQNCLTYTTFGYLIHNTMLRHTLMPCAVVVMKISRAISIWLTVLIAGIRYIAIQYPLHMRTKITASRIRFVIAILSFITGLYYTPRIYITAIQVCRTHGRCQTNETLCNVLL